MQSELNIFWLLLPVAALSGWWIGRLNQEKKRSQKNIHPEYFKGLNFVLNEQPDKAIEVFIRMTEVDSETVETHLALGNLFRRRGEVDRAIRVHQNLIARPTLNQDQRAHALLELGMDYMRSGLLDRAEKLFLELVNSDLYLNEAYSHLLEIYQQEKDWENAISVAKKNEIISGENFSPIIAQFYCEIAENNLNIGEINNAKEKVDDAISFNSKCVRASIIEARIFQLKGKIDYAIKSYKRLEFQDSTYITEVISPLYDCYKEKGNINEFIKYLRELVKKYSNIDTLLTLTELIAEYESEDIAINFVFQELRNRPTVQGVDKLVEYTLNKSEGVTYEYLSAIKQLTTKLIEKKPTYKCSNCGFDAKMLHWQCPGCKHWESIQPTFGVSGE
jgi:lipopolysaccharide biosynthesis regulator YciM